MEEWDITAVEARKAYQQIGGVNMRLTKHAKQGLIIIEHGLATYCWDPDEDGTVWIGEIFVHPAHRRKGIGLQLAQAIRAIPGVKRVRSITSAHRTDVTGMYLRAGHSILYQDDEYIWWEWRRACSKI